MLSFKKILAPTDFSEASFRALEEAAELARNFEGELCVAHVVAPVPALPPDLDYGFEIPVYEERLHSSAVERLEELVERRLPGLPAVRTVVKYGDPPREIVRVAEEENAGLIVIATHGLTGWRHLVFGSVAEKVVRLAPCPVLTIRVPEPESGDSPS